MVLSDKKIKNIVWNFIENATEEELKEISEQIKDKQWSDLRQKRSKFSLLK